MREWEERGRALLLPTVVDREASAAFPLDVWRELARAGLFALAADSPGRHARVASALHGLAKGSLDLPYCASVAAHLAIATDLLHSFGTEGQRRRYLPDMLEGRRIGAICNSEEGAGSDIRLIRSRVTPSLDGTLRVSARKGCATNLSIAGLAIVSCVEEGNGLRVVLLEEGEFRQRAVQTELSSFRTGAIGALEVEDLELPSAARTLAGGPASLRHCFHTERFYLGALVSGLLAGLEHAEGNRIAARETTAERQYLQDKLVALRAERARIEALLHYAYQLSGEGRSWERASVELCVLKMSLNVEAPRAAQALYECLGGAGVRRESHPQRTLRDLQALSYFGGTTELQKLQVFQELARSEGAKRKKSA